MPFPATPHPVRTEFHQLQAIEERLADPQSSWHDVVLQDVDLTSIDDRLASRELSGCFFLGCEVGPQVSRKIAQSECEADPARRCLVFPRMEQLPYNPYRSALYDPLELLGEFPDDDLLECRKVYENSIDWRSYQGIAETNPQATGYLRLFRGDSVDVVIARRLHDTAISHALQKELAVAQQRPDRFRKNAVVAIMGGHDMPRQEKRASGDSVHDKSVSDAAHAKDGDPAGKLPRGKYEWEGLADDSLYTLVALIAWQLTRQGYLMVSGGGPGAMEACNLGAYFATRSIRELRKAIRMLERFPKYQTGKSVEWLIPAMGVRRRFPLAEAEIPRCKSIGIPTWHYGHEPPNPFATHIAKYFDNSVREEGLLAIADGGVIFAPGNAGTVQEIFQDACQNYYQTYGPSAPMVLFSSDYWNPVEMSEGSADRRKQVYPLLKKLASEKGFEKQLIITDSLAEIVAQISGTG
jgi:predicted Rossmann-fold nucleotide-binding protein